MKKFDISRRKFITTTSLGVAGAYLTLHSGLARAMMGGGGGGGMGGGGGGGTIIDPPVGGLLKDLPALELTGGAFNLEARIAPVNVNGAIANLMTYNGSFPGPVIRVRKGDTVRINMKNSLPSTTESNLLDYRRNVTNLHTHGLHVSPKEPADFVMYDLMPGETYYHLYDTSRLEAGTLNFYHPHKHGVSAEQYWAGLVGPLVVEDETPLLAGYETHILVLKDIAISGSSPAPHSMMSDYMHGKEGNIVMVNGQVNPRLYLKKGQVQRWRILNASNARFYRLSLENHSMQLIGTDGGLLDKPYSRSELLLSPGERVDILVQGMQSKGNFRLRALPYSRMGMSGGGTITLMTVTYKGSVLPAQTIPASVNPGAVRLDPNDLAIAARRSLSLSMGQGNGYINGRDFDVNPCMIMSQTGTYEIWTIVNQSGMDHPFHQHVNAGQVLSVSGGDAGYASLYGSIPAWKDTVLVPKWGSVDLLVPVMDFDGMAMFHCHILEHEDIGMMGMWHIMSM
jgi:FtsP/CotA-like multicopper oxidase with cupredoxin domain